MIWNARDFYSNMDRIGEEGSKFSLSYFVLVFASSLLATGGLLANSVPVVIASMCIAPFLGPSRAVSIGCVYKKWRTVVRGLAKQLFGLLAMGSTIAFFITLASLHFITGIIITPETMARTLPTLKDVYLAMLIAMASGIAASFVLVANPRIVSKPFRESSLFNYPRLFDVTIGIEIAISLIPPASVVGIGLAFGRFGLFQNALGLLIVNVWGLDIGAMAVLYLVGIEPKPLQLEKKIKKTIEKTLTSVVNACRISSGVILHSYETADIHIELYAFELPDRADRSLAKIVSKDIERETGVSNDVRIVASPVYLYTS